MAYASNERVKYRCRDAPGSLVREALAQQKTLRGPLMKRWRLALQLIDDAARKVGFHSVGQGGGAAGELLEPWRVIRVCDLLSYF